MKYFEFPGSLLVTGLPYVRTHLKANEIALKPFTVVHGLAKVFGLDFSAAPDIHSKDGALHFRNYDFLCGIKS